MARAATRGTKPQDFNYPARARQRHLGNKAYGQLWPIVDGAVADALKSHPDYLTPKGERSARTSIVKRVTGTVIGFAEQSAKGRGNAAVKEDGLGTVEPQASVPLRADAEAGALMRQPHPNCRIGRVKLKPSKAETELRDENIALGAQVFALECVVASLRSPQPRDAAGRYVSKVEITRQRLARCVSRLTPEEAQSARMRGMGGGR